MNIRSILTGQSVKPGELEYNWQQFVMDRQEILEEKLDTTEMAAGYRNEDAKLNAILESIEAIVGQENSRDLYDAIIYKQLTATYLHYNKGFLDGIKFATMAGQL
ncbi:hypothetical protein SPSIL_020120 [Sporomusa silvacetica DSM 10669]|uniref:Uncharacterized protein n=1 Tax=Sporomusa silvacetica DSM 10669 TaxID=1123289 RepID=A0ABZ3IJT3_9FIRM|nr:hypothetical protein [Sporomusa silvacetica]OZC18735.1 hypothetical protein SPSIL_23440 [Sporomusa silvacetica DSM 10669]